MWKPRSTPLPTISLLYKNVLTHTTLNSYIVEEITDLLKGLCKIVVMFPVTRNAFAKPLRGDQYLVCNYQSALSFASKPAHFAKRKTQVDTRNSTVVPSTN